MRAWRSFIIPIIFSLTLLTACVRDHLKQARQFELRGDYQSAVQAYKDALAQLPEHEGARRAAILMDIGDCFFRNQRIQEAYRSFQKAAEADPANVMAHLRMGEMLLAAGAADRAREQGLIALSSDSNNTEALALLGASWTATDNPELAKQAYERALENDPKRVTVAVALADIYNHDNDPARAETTLRNAAAADPTSALPWLSLGRLQEQQGDERGAEASYRKAISLEDTPEANLRLAQFLQRAARVTEAEQVLRKVDAQRADHPVALGDFELASGRLDNALQQYRSALHEDSPAPLQRKQWFLSRKNTPAKTDTRDTGVIAARMIEAQILNASLAPDSRRKQDITLVRAQLQQNAFRFDAATNAVLQAEIALADDNVAQADSFAQAALQLATDSPAAHYVAGLVAAAKDDDETAQTEWQNALDQDSHFSPARLSLAQSALDHGNGAEADQQSRLVVRDDPGDLQGILIFARALLLEGKPTAAAVMAQRAAALSPASPQPAAILGEASLKVGNLPGALLNFERALVVSDDCEEAITGLLQVYRRGTPSYPAIRKMEDVAEQPPRSAALLEIAGRLYAEYGWYADAQRSLTKAVTLNPDRKTAARVLAELQESGGNFDLASDTAQSSGVASQPLLSAYREQQSGDWQKAIASYERALREGDPTGAAANNLAWLYAEHHLQFDRALTLAEAAVQRSPNQPALIDTLGFVHLQRREYTQAVNYLEHASRLAARNDDSAENRELQQQIRGHLSEAYLHTGQTDAAARLAHQDNLWARSTPALR